jgi:hypothetical protein
MTADPVRPDGTPPGAKSGRAQARVAAALLTLGSVLLVAKGAASVWTDQNDSVEPWAGWLTLAFAGLAAVAAEAALRTRRRAGPLAAAAALGALISDQIPTAPPRYLAALPLAAATVILLAPTAQESVEGAAQGRGQQGTHGWRAAVGWAVVAVGWAGVALQLLVGIPYLFSGLVVPEPWPWAFWLLWVVLFVITVRLRARRPALTPLVPIASVALWWAAVTAGEYILGWAA